MIPDESRLIIRQISQKRSIRLLTFYSFALGIPLSVALAFMSHWGSQSTSGRSWIATNLISTQLTSWLQGVVLGVAAVGGAILVRSPLPNGVEEIIDDFARRFTSRGHGGLKVQPLHGAILLARLVCIVPLCLTAGVLVGERKLSVAIQFAAAMCRFIAAGASMAFVCGALAIWMHQRKLRWPLTTWFTLWVAPEIVRLFAPESPSCRSVFFWILSAAAGSWGPS